MIRTKFSFLETNFNFTCINEEDTKFMDVAIITYRNRDMVILRIEKERGYYTCKILNGNEVVDFMVFIEKLKSNKFNNADYYGDNGLLKLAEEVNNNLLIILKSQSN